MKRAPPQVPVHPEAHNVALFGKRVFVHIIQLRIKMRLGTRVSPEGQHPYKRQGGKNQQQQQRLGKKKAL